MVSRLWARDHSLWSPDPAEIADRLGWLDSASRMRERASDLRLFGEQVRSAGYRHVVVLGMGGSSLGPEVLRQTLPETPSFPVLKVLDSTVPAAVKQVADDIDPARTLFLVSSKSGSTIEPNSMYAYFRELVEAVEGTPSAGEHFAAITDPGTVLGQLAQDASFRRVFENFPDIGGRFSVLSYFGLVPAAIAGFDVDKLVSKAMAMSDLCDQALEAQQNAGAWLGAFMAANAGAGRDKLTLITSPSIASFGLWAEQLLAESSGKNGKGIVPIAEEPLLEPDAYGEDRAFVYLRMEGDENASLDVGAERLAAQGHPVVRFDLRDPYDVAGEFFRWEFATAIACALLGIHPFDQPNVQSAKDAANDALQRGGAASQPVGTKDSSLVDILAQAKPGDYLAILAFVAPTGAVDRAVTALRRLVMQQHRIATTAGYGPRYLHSTGQLHKGGPDSGIFLELVAQEGGDLPIPGSSFSFGALADAQAQGDYDALRAAGRRVARVDLGSDAESGLLRLLGSMHRA